MPYKDKAKQKAYQAAHYESKKRREAMVERNRRERRTRRTVVEKYKLQKGCYICGYKKCVASLDAHHPGDKNGTISTMIQRCANIDAILAELELCDIICSNCHKELHFVNGSLGHNRAPLV